MRILKHFLKLNIVFQSVISNCILLLVQDLENSCEPALNAMTKV
jgi:hypothetical protein